MGTALVNRDYSITEIKFVKDELCITGEVAAQIVQYTLFFPLKSLTKQVAHHALDGDLLPRTARQCVLVR